LYMPMAALAQPRPVLAAGLTPPRNMVAVELVERLFSHFAQRARPWAMQQRVGAVEMGLGGSGCGAT
jgi:hypothetical protein